MITIIRWWKLKAKQIKIKLAFYGAVEYVLDNYKDIANDVKDLIPAGMKILDFVKNYSGDNFQSDFISALAEVVHNDVNIKTDEEQ